MSSQANFAKKLSELETITAWFESDNVDLDEALAKFERGMVLADELKRELQQVENRVEKIKQRFDVAPAAGDPEPPTAGGLDNPEPAEDTAGDPKLFD